MDTRSLISIMMRFNSNKRACDVILNSCCNVGDGWVPFRKIAIVSVLTHCDSLSLLQRRVRDIANIVFHLTSKIVEKEDSDWKGVCTYYIK